MKIGNLEVYGVIYKITNKVNGKVYIGQTIEGFKKRYKNNLKKYTHNNHLRNSIQKYGIDNFDICEVFDIAFTLDELNIKEKVWIDIYNSINSNYGYNKHTGGDNYKTTEETKKKISENHADINGKNNPMYGKHHTEETKEKIRQSKSGSNNPMYGIVGKEHPNYGKKQSEETIEKLKKNNPKNKKILCVTTGKIFISVREGARYYNCDHSSIIKCCKGKQKTAGTLKDGTKLVWSYFYGENEVVA